MEGTFFTSIWCLGFIAIFFVFFFFSCFRKIEVYEQGVVFRHGKFVGVKKSRLIFLWPFLDHLMKVDMRTLTLNVFSGETISRDQVGVEVNIAVYFRVIDAQTATLEVADYSQAVETISQDILGKVVNMNELDTLLVQQERINEELEQAINKQTQLFGVEVSGVDIKNVRKLS